MHHSAKITDHHNVPQSLGGSDDPVNISRIEDNRHNNFHEWALNFRSCQLTRFLILHAIGSQQPPAVETVEDIFQILTMQDWTRLHQPEAFKKASAPGGLRRARKNAEYMRTHYLTELVDIRNSIAAIINGGRFPIKQSMMLPTAQKFFNVGTGVKVIQRMYSEKDHEQESAWVKSMQEDTRRSVLETINNDGSRKKRSLRAYRSVLHTQARKIEEHHALWERDLLMDKRRK